MRICFAYFFKLNILNDFNFYLQQGINHILDFDGYDHMLFVAVLCALYELKEWKKVLILLTAFTVGHSVTLILSGLKVLNLNQDLIETLIPITICLTAIHNLVFYRNAQVKKGVIPYIAALFFGFVHGAGFSNFFRAMYMGISDSVVFPLIGFNLGIELGQIVIVLVFFALYFLLKTFLKVPHKNWNTVVSGAGFIVAALLLFGVL